MTQLLTKYDELVAEGVSGEELQNLKQEILELQTDLSDNENAIKDQQITVEAQMDSESQESQSLQDQISADIKSQTVKMA